MHEIRAFAVRTEDIMFGHCEYAQMKNKNAGAATSSGNTHNFPRLFLSNREINERRTFSIFMIRQV